MYTFFLLTRYESFADPRRPVKFDTFLFASDMTCTIASQGRLLKHIHLPLCMPVRWRYK